MLKICDKFVHANDVIFNCIKSLSIKYGFEMKEKLETKK